LDFLIEYNGNQIVSVSVNEKAKELELLEDIEAVQFPVKVEFTYSVTWKENTEIKFSRRGQTGKSFFPATFEIHWLSIINSAVLVLLLTGFVITILARTLRKDFVRYAQEDEDVDLENDMSEDQGWKMVHKDVFRFPQYKSLLCAVLGNGVQFMTLCLLLIVLAMMGAFNVHRHGSMNAALVLVYALTCCINGYVSNRFYKQLEGQKWAWNIVVTSCVFTVPFFVMWSIVNSTAWYMGSTQALPATTIIILLLIWLCVGFPLTVMGGIMGKNHAGPFEAPCRTKNIPREIPSVPIHRSLPAHLIIGGFLPFSVIFVELYYIFVTLWGREHYTLWGVLLLVLFILIAVTVCISVTLTYFMLNSEDYRWWWRSIFAAGFIGVFVFAYSLFYYHVRSNMSGTLQTVQFFCYTSLVCYIFFLTLGTVGFLSSLSFTRYIYKNLKLD
jgi:transmembrane 9 superfamily protein 1